jgi:rhodanese-related sulfurtransferase
MNKSWKRVIIARAVALTVAALLIGLAFNSASPLGVDLWGGNGQGGPSSGNGDGPEVTAITWEDAKLWLTTGEAVLVDARPPAAYKVGRIPGAVSLPANSINEKIPEFIDEHDFETLLIVYCADSNCDSSERAAKALIRYGYKNVLHMPGGYAEWQVAQASTRKPETEKKP